MPRKDTILLTTYLSRDQLQALGNVRVAAERIWSRPLHRYYTDHTVAHSQRVIALLDGLTGGMMATGKRLSPDEVFILLAAAYLHDIGMQDERFEGGDLETIRAAHHEVAAEMIFRAAEDPAHAVNLGLPYDPGLAEAVALVAKGHRRVDLASEEYDSLVHGGGTVRLRLLAALLRLSDELDIDHRRVDLEVMKLLALPLESQLHWWRCYYVSGVSIADEYIKIVYRFPQNRPDYQDFIAPLIEVDVRSKLVDLEDILRANAVKAALGKAQVRLMRLVRPLPSEVEALAQKGAELASAARPRTRPPLLAPPEHLEGAYNLPPTPYSKEFIGRHRELETLHQALRDPAGHWMIAIEGFAGVGKTTLAYVAVKEAEAEGLFQSIFWESAKPEVFTGMGVQKAVDPILSFEQLIDDIIDILGPRRFTRLQGIARIAAVRQVLKDGRFLIVVDNLETVVDYRELIPNLWGMLAPSKALLTSRHRLHEYHSVFPVPVNGLPKNDAIRFMRKEAEFRTASRVIEASEHELETVHNATGGLPLAMKLVVGQAVSISLSHILANLRQIPSDAGEDIYVQFYHFLFWDAWRLLSDGAQELLIAMGSIPLSGADEPDLLEISGMSRRIFSKALREIYNHSLVESEPGLRGDKYYLHPLTYQFVRSDLMRSPNGESA